MFQLHWNFMECYQPCCCRYSKNVFGKEKQNKKSGRTKIEFEEKECLMKKSLNKIQFNCIICRWKMCCLHKILKLIKSCVLTQVLCLQKKLMLMQKHQYQFIRFVRMW